MIAEDRARYRRLRAMCEFMTNAASAIEHSDGVSEVLRSRLSDAVRPVREAREWLWDIGRLMTLPRPSPVGLHEALEITEGRALAALPAFRAAMNDACEEFFRAARRMGPATSGGLDGAASGADRRLRRNRVSTTRPTP